MDDTAPDETAPDDGVVSNARVRVRRAPRYARFIILGAGLGAVITFVLTALYPADSDVGFAALFGYFSLLGVPAGAVVGAILAIVFDAVANRRAKELDAELTTVTAPPEDVEGRLED